ncbi:hypothetical protein [Mycolicibacterium neoaurum]|uniref:hypothetical protein n=1 Tax=Mycolicibacterium neoaurum TaxID=1795 RepID=UPI000302B08B|nr:DUF732 domain-containing protein [Mycolicibacterium neoaurum]KUM06436.1 hypothetical protein AVZ31_21345 [Mycolicibacterium neoaurum]
MVQRNGRLSAGLAKWPTLRRTPLLLAVAAMAVGALSCGCTAGDTTLASVGMPAEESSMARTDGMMGATRSGGPSEHLTVTPRQQSYLDALVDSGVHPSDDLMALSIGAYVCQARAAKQSEQAVWDFVLPLVRNDLHDAHSSSMTPEVGDVDAATADYIRIATERLC